MTRVAIVSHSHPKLQYGGGEVAAYRQFEHLKKDSDDVIFVGCAIGPEDSAKYFGAAQKILSFGRNDFCMRGNGMDPFVMEHTRLEDEDWFYEFLNSISADVYHFHHFWNIGAGTIRRLRRAKPEAKFIGTLHEMTAICANHGQMMKTSGELCYSSGEIECAKCIGRAPVEFVVRKKRMKDMLDLFDHLISPSVFLKDRFVDWGVPSERISVIENGLDYSITDGDELDQDLPGKSRRFAFFGQATPTKGLDVLIRAAALIEMNGDPANLLPSFEVHGVDEEKFRSLWPKLDIPGSVIFKGRYRPQECINIMRDYGWIIIPSVWWENSPVVIQEARAAGIPMIASNIGGMLEKTDGWGIQFRVGDPSSLARAVMSVHGREDILAEYKARITAPLNLAGFVSEWAEACDIGL